MASALVMLAVAGCGGGQNPEEVLDKAFSQSIGSAEMDLSLDATLQGIPAATDPIRIALTGPYQSGGDETLPSFDLAASLEAGSLPAPGDTLSLISTGTNLFIEIAGTAYEAGEDVVAKEIAGRSESDAQSNPFGVDPRTWVEDPKIVGEEQVDGVETLHLTGAISVEAMVRNLNDAGAKAAEAGQQEVPVLTDEQITEIEGVLENPTFDLYTGKDDGKIRRLSASVTFTVPEAERQGMGGLSGGKIAFQLNFTGVGEPVTITAPENAEPLKDLASQIQTLAGAAMTGQDGGGAAGGPGGAGGDAIGGAGGDGADGGEVPLPALPPDGGASPPGDEAFQEYTDCLAQADPNDSGALADCAKLVSGG